MKLKQSLKSFAQVFLVAGILQACSSGSDNGPATTNNPNASASNSSAFTYIGPAAKTADIQQFRTRLWENLVTTGRCSNCHSTTGGQQPYFARTDDVNLAYSDVNSFIDRTTPGDSSLVQKFSNGHFCWEQDNNVCMTILTRWISDWVNVNSGGSNGVTLQAPPQVQPGTSKNFPSSSATFASTVYPVLRNYCVDCHIETAANNPVSPFFAADDVDAAYLASQSMINLDRPQNSRFYARLASEFHNCWSNCGNDATTMLNAINAFANPIQPSSVDPNHISSMAIKLFEGIISSSGGRNENDLIALYEFKTGNGTTAFDTSGVSTATHLNLTGDVSWVGGWGISLNGGKAQASVDSSKKLFELIKSTGEYSIETWVIPNNVTQEGPAPIISYSAGNNSHNFLLGQTLYDYNFLHRSSTTNTTGLPAHSTPTADEVLQATLQHVVVTSNPVEGRKIYVNGSLINATDPVQPGNLNDWDDTFAFVLGNDPASRNAWRGILRLVAIYNRAIPAAQVSTNFNANVGERFFLLFGVSHLVNIPQAFVVIEVSQFDSYSYLFNQPFFVSLDPNASYANVPLEGMRIGINAKLATAGQAFASISTTLDSSQKDADGRQYLSNIGTVIALDRGATLDEFYLVFDRLGSQTFAITDPVAPPSSNTGVNREQSDIGLKTFDEINASMSTATGIPRTNTGVADTYGRIRQQLPSVETVEAFLASHQVAISQLAVKYCNELVEAESLQTAQSRRFFSGVDFNQSASTAFSNPDLLTEPLIDNFIGSSLTADPGYSDVKPHLQTLISTLTSCGNSCAADRTKTVSKAVCASVLASATTLLQ